MNKVILMGRLGKDPDDLKTFASGSDYTSFSLATTETWRDKLGEKQEKTEWHTVSVIGKMASSVVKYLKKGSQCLVEGSIKYETYDNDKGKQYTTKIKAETVTFIGEKKESIPSLSQASVSDQELEDLPF